MELHESKYGATRQSWNTTSIRTIFAEIQASHPRHGHAALVLLLIQRMKEDDEAIEAAADYIVTNCSNSQEGYAKRQQRTFTAEEKSTRKEVVAATVENIKNQVLLLNLEMPNGKRMRYCTGAEMNNFGMAYRRIAKKVGNTKMVGSVLNEKQVQELL